jgi:hypothetical protein
VQKPDRFDQFNTAAVPQTKNGHVKRAAFLEVAVNVLANLETAANGYTNE